MSLIKISKISDELMSKLESIFDWVQESKYQVDPSQVATYDGIQSENLMETKFSDILEEIMDETKLNELFSLFHVHSIEYNKGGYQKEHTHPPDDYSFVLYFDTEQTGATGIAVQDHKLMIDQIRGNIVVFPPNLPHVGLEVKTKKRILVGALKFKKSS
jgi:hypothetical protein